MSHEPSHVTEHLAPPAVQAEEGLRWGSILGVGLGWALLFFATIFITVKVLHAREKTLQPDGPDPLPRQIGQAEIGIVDQVPFEVYRSLEIYKKERAAQLGNWGWVDRKAGTVHMPIAEAMDRVVKEHQK